MDKRRGVFMRRGVFIKMFAWFWLVMAVVIAIIFALDRLTDTWGRETPLNYAVEAPLAYYGKIALERIEKGDKAGLADVLTRLKSAAGMTAFFFGPGGTEIDGSSAPQEVTEIAARARTSGKPAIAFTRARILAAVPLESSRGTKCVAVGRVPNRVPVSSWSTTLFILPRLGIALVISLVACYLLTRYLTVPLIRLSEATRRLASGNLDPGINPKVERRRDEVGELARDFDVMSEKLRALLSAQRQLLGNISHELRSPLARLNVALEIARRNSTPEAGKSLDRIEWEAERLNELIGELLTLTRLEATAAPALREEIDMEALVAEIADDADFEAKSLNKAVKVTETQKCTVTGVRQLLRSAIENVIRNAVWYTKEGTDAEISLRCIHDKNQTRAIITVRDHGPGVPEEALAQLFRPFYRVAEARERHTGGTGLGLAITERAVLIHGGSVKAENAGDGGLVVEIGVPGREGAG